MPTVAEVEGLRVAFYCHLVQGLGHLMRTLRIAEATLDAGADCCLVTGGKRLEDVPIDKRLELTLLPPVELSGRGHLAPVGGDEIGDVMRCRAETIRSFCSGWRPDAMLVDHMMLGIGGELLDTLLTASREQWHTRFNFGVPYRHGTAIRIANPRVREAMQQYDRVIAYSDRGWMDPLDGYGAPLPANVTYAGVVTGPRPHTDPPAERVLVGLTGAGHGGLALFEKLLVATHEQRSAGSLRLRFVAGLLAPDDAVSRAARTQPGVDVWPDGTVEDAVRGASAVVSRAGYNTAFSLMTTDLPVVLVPLPRPYNEQHDRARRMADLVNVWLVDERSPDAERELALAVHQALDARRRPRPLPFRITGAQETAARLIRSAIEARRREAAHRQR